jgi:hypothetical protein
VATPDRSSVSTWAQVETKTGGPNPIEAVVAADVSRLDTATAPDDAAVVLYTIGEPFITAVSRCQMGRATSRHRHQ